MVTYTVETETDADTIQPVQRGDCRSGNQGRDEGDLRFVEFVLGKDYFAIDLFLTREVITPSEITPLPNTPTYIKGVMDPRGSITTIIDLKMFINITGITESKKRSRIIILDKKITSKPVGILVDGVYSVSTHRSADIDRDTENMSDKSRNIIGVIRKVIKVNGREENKLILWLDIQVMMDLIEKEI